MHVFATDVATRWHGRFFVDIYVILNYVTTPINLVRVRGVLKHSQNRFFEDLFFTAGIFPSKKSCFALFYSLQATH